MLPSRCAKDDIETRCRQFNHALLVLAQLESWLDMERPSEPAKLIALFYAQTRAVMMDAGVQKSPAVLEKQIASIVHVRSAWQQLDTPSVAHSIDPSTLRLPELPPDRTLRSHYLREFGAAWVREERMKALVVDSSKTMRSVLARILSMRGLVVAEAETAREAVTVLEAMGQADLVLVDWNLPGGGGLEFVARLRRELAYDTKVILLATNEPGIREVHRAVIAGADAYLIKPFTSLQIDEELNQAGYTWHTPLSS